MATLARELAGPWRFDELPQREDLPEFLRYEVVDGHLVVTPPPGHRHQFAASALLLQLGAACSPAWRVVQELALPLGTDGRVPDLAVISSRPPDGRGPYPRGPEFFGLVVEIVSPSSRKTDLFAKPGEYAEAGIPLFWRLDLDPVPRLHVFRLEQGRYIEDAVLDGPGLVPAPWGQVRVDLTDLPGQ